MAQRDTTHTTPIAIVGGGPVGLVLALFLDRHGVRSTVFNTKTGPRFHPKAARIMHAR